MNNAPVGFKHGSRWMHGSIDFIALCAILMSVLLSALLWSELSYMGQIT